MKRFKKISKVLIAVSLITVSAFALLKTGVLGKEKNAIIVDPNARYDIVADLDGGKFEPGSKPEFVKMDNGKWLYKYKPTVSPTKIPKPVKEGYTFGGWVLEGETIPKPEYLIPSWNKKNINLKAHWKVSDSELVDGLVFNKSVSNYSNFYRVKEIRFIKSKPSNISNFIDLSQLKNKSIIGYISNDVFYVASDSNILLQPNSSKMFRDFKNITKITFDNINTKNVTNFSEMFDTCSSLQSVDLLKFNTSKATTFYEMFKGCTSLIRLDLSSFKTSKVTNMQAMFSLSDSPTSTSLLEIIGLENFDTRNVTNMRHMFNYCNRITELNVSNFNTAKVVDISQMFEGCSELIKADTSRFDLSSVTDSSYMFKDCSKLSGEITIQNNSIAAYTLMFNGCSRDVNSKFWVKYSESNLLDKVVAMVKTKDILTDHVYYTVTSSNLCTSSSFRNKINALPNFSSIKRIQFVRGEPKPGIDLSAKQDTSITGYVVGDTLNIACTGDIIADSNCNYMFSNLGNIISIDLNELDTSNVTSMHGMFSSCVRLENINFGTFDTHNVTTMNNLFSECKELKDINLSSFNTQKLTDMRNMFKNCSSLTDLDISMFDTRNVSEVASLVYGCANLRSINLKGLDFRKVTNISNMFENCSQLKRIDTNVFDFDSINTAYSVFAGCSNLSGDITIRNKKSMACSGIFSGCSTEPNTEFWVKYKTPEAKILAQKMVNTKNPGDHVYLYEPEAVLLPGPEFNSKVKAMPGFSNITEIKFVKATPNQGGTDLSEAQDGLIKGIISGNILTIACDSQLYTNSDCSSMFKDMRNIVRIIFNNLDTSKTINMSEMFSGCIKITALPTQQMNTKNVTNMYNMFNNCLELVSISVSNFDTTNVTNMSGMFAIGGVNVNYYTQPKIEYISGFENLNTANVTDMSNLFKGCKTLKSINLNNINTNNVTNMASMFEYCSALTSINLSRFNTSKVTDMNHMFSCCMSISNFDLRTITIDNVRDISWMFSACHQITSIDVSRFNTNNVTNISGLFSACENLRSIDLTNFNTSNVTDMSYLFNSCDKISNINISTFNTSNVTNMERMFAGCYILKNINLNNFNTSNVKRMNNMFTACKQLEYLDLSHFDTRNVKSYFSMFRMCHNLTGNITIMTEGLKYTDTEHAGIGAMFAECSRDSGRFTVNYISDATRLSAEECVKTAKYTNNVMLGTKKPEPSRITIKDFFILRDFTLPGNEKDSINDTVLDQNQESIQTYNQSVNPNNTSKPVKLTLINGPSAQYPKQVMQITNNKIPNLNAPDLNPLYAGQFGGYYYDEQFTKPVKQGDVITRDLTIYARW